MGLPKLEIINITTSLYIHVYPKRYNDINFSKFDEETSC